MGFSFKEHACQVRPGGTSCKSVAIDYEQATAWEYWSQGLQVHFV